MYTRICKFNVSFKGKKMKSHFKHKKNMIEIIKNKTDIPHPMYVRTLNANGSPKVYMNKIYEDLNLPYVIEN